MRKAKLFATLFAATLVASATTACQETDPKKPATWIAQLEGKDARKVQDAARELRKMKAKEAVPALVAGLKTEEMATRAEVAYALGEIGDASAVKPLADAVDLKSSAKGIDLANSKIAEALGTLGDKAALPTLLKMADGAPAQVRLDAVKALTKLKDPSSVGPLVKLVEDEKTPPLIVKHAIIALGEMKAGDAVPALAKAMVMERQGVSFYPDASYALFQVGEPAAKGLLAILDGSDKAYLAWAESKSRLPAGYLSKAAVVLADIGARDAAPAITKLLTWEADDEGHQLLVRGQAAEALGRLRAKEAADKIGKLADTVEANIRGQVARALANIGDKSQAGKLEAAAKGSKYTWGARMEAASGLALLGDGKSKSTFEALAKSETPDASVKHCMDEESTESDEMKKSRCEKERTARPAFIADALAALLAGDECKDDVACWAGKAADKSTRVRERAAASLGRSGDAKAVEPLAALAKDAELSVRRAAYIGLDWLTQAPGAKDALVAKRDALAKQYDEEKGKAHTVIVNEDLKRVVWKLKQL
jgi:HEAT repeat protein